MFRAFNRSRQDLKFIMALGPANLKSIITLLSKSKSQLKQDLFILSETKYKRGGISLNLAQQMESI